MNPPGSAPLRYPPIAEHGVIGDRRTGALVAADGTINWLCVPDFDGEEIFGALLDAERGGRCRLGPLPATMGRQEYVPGTAVLTTVWEESGVEVADVMARPGGERRAVREAERVIIRRVWARRDATVAFEIAPRRGFAKAPEASVARGSTGGMFSFHDGLLSYWASFPTEVEKARGRASVSMEAGEEHWVVVGWCMAQEEWDAGHAEQIFAEAEETWREWSAGLKVRDGGERTGALERSALMVQLLSHADWQSAVAALTTSLPERIGGDRNYDYRYTWVRDASLSLALLARFGKATEVRGYLHWLCCLRSTTPAPLQVCYRLDGDPHLEQHDMPEAAGYRESRPVRRGNRAAKQMQLGSMAFFADCASLYLEHGGEWREEFWELLRRAAEFTARHWHEEDSGVWELPQRAHYVASRVMSWVVLERATAIAARTGHAGETDHWRETASAIHAQVMDQGWCAEKNSFRQRYGSDALDAAALLIPLMKFLPPDHPRVLGTIAALEGELLVEGLMHRFDPGATLGGEQLPVGKFEGAFLPCVFWHAHALAGAGRCAEAEAVLARCEAVAGPLGIFAEEIDAARGAFLGNTPLLFSHVEYARAVLALNEARDRAARPERTGT